MSQIFAVCINEIDSQRDFEWLKKHVSTVRRNKIEKFYFESDAKRSLLAGILLEVYAKLHKMQILDMEGTNKYGKPYWKIEGAPQFNISHSDEWVVCGFDNCNIGIDIEKIQPIETDIEGMARLLSYSEYGFIMQASKSKRAERFIRIWNMKESYSKCMGYGLSLPLESYSVCCDEILKEEANCWKFPFLNGMWIKQQRFLENYFISECNYTDSDMAVKELSLKDIKKIIES